MMMTPATRYFLAIALMGLLPAALSSCNGLGTESQGEADLQQGIDEQPAARRMHHAINYIEFTVTDMAEAKRFYSQAFGWEFNDYGPDYAGIKKAGGEAGGLRLDEQINTGGPLVILYSQELDGTLESVRLAGGRITTAPFAFPGGRRFHFEDPSGNELAVYSDR